MKFLAILKDSLREAIDAKVFYVMVGLSILLIALASTARFEPKPGGKMLMEMAAVPLSIDLSNFDPAELQGGKRGPHGDEGDGPHGPDLSRMFRRVRGQWKVKEVSPLHDAEDLPTSDFRVVVEQAGNLPFFFTRPKPEKAIEQIRERFGQWDSQPIAEVLDVRHDNGNYVIDARVTDVGRRMWPYSFSLFFGALPVFREGVPLGMQLYGLETILVNGIGSWIAILVSIVITAFFIPNMLRKGTVDMLIVKPIHRTTLLLYKYIGGLLFILINTTIAVGGVWLALSARSGIWAPGFLASIGVITFFFAILYSVSTMFGVLTRSPIVAILMTLGAWFLLFIVGTVHLVFEAIGKQEQAQARRNATQLAATSVGLLGAPDAGGPLVAASAAVARRQAVGVFERTDGTFARVVRAVHFVLPRTSDLDTLMTSQLQRDLLVLPRGMGARMSAAREMTWGESLTVSGVFIALMLGVSCWWFATKDY